MLPLTNKDNSELAAPKTWHSLMPSLTCEYLDTQNFNAMPSPNALTESEKRLYYHLATNDWSILFLLNRVQLFTKKLIHSKHVNSLRFENQLHLIIAYNLTFVARILKVETFDMFPNLFDNLWPRQLLEYVSIRGRQLNSDTYCWLPY